MNIIKKIKKNYGVISFVAILISFSMSLLVECEVIPKTTATIFIGFSLIAIAMLFFFLMVQTPSWLNAIKTPRTKNLYGEFF